MYRVFTKAPDQAISFEDQMNACRNLIDGLMKMSENVVVVYHDKCNDGCAAAAVVRSEFAINKEWPGHVEMVPATYATDVITKVNNRIDADVRPLTTVLFVDFCPRPEVMAVLSRTYFVIVIDHHASSLELIRPWEAEQDKRTQDRVLIIGDDYNTMSGALMTNWLFAAPMPMLNLSYIDRYDRFDKSQEWPMVQNVAALTKNVIANNPGDVQAPMAVGNLLKLPPNELRAMATAYGESYKQFIDTMAMGILGSAKGYTDAEGMRRAVLFTSQKSQISDICESIRNADADIYFSVGLYINNGEAEFSIRSREGSPITAEEIAKIFGGGGHKNAAGFITRLDGIAQADTTIRTIVHGFNRHEGQYDWESLKNDFKCYPEMGTTIVTLPQRAPEKPLSGETFGIMPLYDPNKELTEKLNGLTGQKVTEFLKNQQNPFEVQVKVDPNDPNPMQTVNEAILLATKSRQNQMPEAIPDCGCGNKVTDKIYYDKPVPAGSCGQPVSPHTSNIGNINGLRPRDEAPCGESNPAPTNPNPNPSNDCGCGCS